MAAEVHCGVRDSSDSTMGLVMTAYSALWAGVSHRAKVSLRLRGEPKVGTLRSRPSPFSNDLRKLIKMRLTAGICSPLVAESESQKDVRIVCKKELNICKTPEMRLTKHVSAESYAKRFFPVEIFPSSAHTYVGQPSLDHIFTTSSNRLCFCLQFVFFLCILIMGARLSLA